MNISEWLEQYGYWAVFLGVFVEGPLVLALAGFMVHQGYINVVSAFAAGFCGSFILVEASYLAGLAGGRWLLGRRPTWQDKQRRFESLLKKQPALFLLGFRFLHGAQVIAAVAIGATRINPKYFTAMNAAGSTLYALVFIGFGFFFGHSFQMVVENVARHERPIAMALVALMLCYHLWRRFGARRSRVTARQAT